VASRKTQRIHPSPKMPVVILYLTASIDTGGKVRFYKDVYNRDQKVLDALNGPVIIDVPDR
jgi:murein L,D-transpeptidase YcbB/YkuD